MVRGFAPGADAGRGEALAAPGARVSVIQGEGERQRHPWMGDTCQGATPCGLHIASVEVCPGYAGIKKLCRFLVGTAHISERYII